MDAIRGVKTPFPTSAAPRLPAQTPVLAMSSFSAAKAAMTTDPVAQFKAPPPVTSSVLPPAKGRVGAAVQGYAQAQNALGPGSITE